MRPKQYWTCAKWQFATNWIRFAGKHIIWCFVSNRYTEQVWIRLINGRGLFCCKSGVLCKKPKRTKNQEALNQTQQTGAWWFDWYQVRTHFRSSVDQESRKCNRVLIDIVWEMQEREEDSKEAGINFPLNIEWLWNWGLSAAHLLSIEVHSSWAAPLWEMGEEWQHHIWKGSLLVLLLCMDKTTKKQNNLTVFIINFACAVDLLPGNKE